MIDWLTCGGDLGGKRDVVGRRSGEALGQGVDAVPGKRTAPGHGSAVVVAAASEEEGRDVPCHCLSVTNCGSSNPLTCISSCVQSCGEFPLTR